MENIVTCTCPHCGQAIRIKRPAKAGRYKYSCTQCKQPFLITFKDEVASQPQLSSSSPERESHKESEVADRPVRRVFAERDRYKTIGGLVEKGKGFFAKSRVIPLSEGTVTIGRRSSRMPSDISFDDPGMSRQSVEITVVRQTDEQGQAFSYILKPLRLKNPILHNGEELTLDDEIILHIGDTLKLGQTILTLK